MKPQSFGKPVKAALHHFSDASQVGYGIVSYLRIENNDDVHVSFVIGKARVAPLKQVTIPRLELAAAVLAVHVDKMLLRELQLQLEGSFFWTDSTTVLKYITNETRRFHTFVANRVSVIREATDIQQWRYVNTKHNPADEASRGLTAKEFVTDAKWLKGPEFLSLPASEWPTLDLDSSLIPVDDPEVRKEPRVNVIVKYSDTPTDRLIHYFSSWRTLRTSVAWLLELRECLWLLRQKRKELVASKSDKVEQELKEFKITLRKSNLSPECWDKAERAIVCYVQKQRFSSEIASLKGSKNVSKDSPLYRLDPFLEDGLLRVGGRLSKSALPV